jgi:hypothetical protein
MIVSFFFLLDYVVSVEHLCCGLLLSQNRMPVHILVYFSIFNVSTTLYYDASHNRNVHLNHFICLVIGTFSSWALKYKPSSYQHILLNLFISSLNYNII